MNEFPKWKYALIAVILVLGAIYALPNVFAPLPAVQVSANRGGSVDEALKERVLGVLQKNKFKFKSVDINGDRLLARLNDSETQGKAQTAISAELGDKYTVALNLASTVPSWLSAIGANSMPLGLDLQGGVHFLLEVDQKAALDKMQQRFRDDISTALRDAKIHYESVNTTPAGVVITLKSEDDRKAAGNIIAKQVNQPEKLGDQPPLEIVDGTTTADSYALIARVRDATVQAQARSTIASNLTTLRNRVNQLGVSEPTIQQQGANRIVVELAGVHDTAEAKKILGATATLEYRAVDENATGPANQSNPGAREIEKSGNVPPESRLYYMQNPGADGKPIPIILSKRVIATRRRTGRRHRNSRSTNRPAGRGGAPECQGRPQHAGIHPAIGRQTHGRGLYRAHPADQDRRRQGRAHLQGNPGGHFGGDDSGRVRPALPDHRPEQHEGSHRTGAAAARRFARRAGRYRRGKPDRSEPRPATISSRASRP